MRVRMGRTTARMGAVALGVVLLALVALAASRAAGTAVFYKEPVAANVFIGGDPVIVVERVAGIPPDRQVGAYSVAASFDPDAISFVMTPGDFLGSTGRNVTCGFTYPSSSIVIMSCNSSGSAPGPTGGGELALITVSPAPLLVIRPTSNNGIYATLHDLAAYSHLTDTLGQPIPINQVYDSYLVVRALEGDVNKDCQVNVIDEQTIAGRYFTRIGSLLYNKYYDLEPPQTDGDIDIKDVQFVFGRDGSTCETPIPPQPPPPPPITPTTPSPTATPSLTPTPSATVPATLTPTPSATTTPTPPASPTITTTPAATATATPTRTPTPAGTVSPTATPAATRTATPIASATATATASPQATVVATATAIVATPTPPTGVPVASPTAISEVHALPPAGHGPSGPQGSHGLLALVAVAALSTLALRVGFWFESRKR